MGTWSQRFTRYPDCCYQLKLFARVARGSVLVLHRGLKKNKCLWNFDAAIHNILKVFRHAPQAITNPTTA